MVLQDAQPKVVIVSPNFYSNVKDAAPPVMQLVPEWEDSIMSSAEAAAAFTPPVMVSECLRMPLVNLYLRAHLLHYQHSN